MCVFRNRNGWAYRIQVAGLLISFSLIAFTSGLSYPNSDGKRDDRVIVYAKADWFRARPEPEKIWQGTLYSRDSPVGPNTRNALKFTLRCGKNDIPVYAAGVEEKLASFLGKRISVKGKLVDLRAEGHGKEIWIASLRTIQAQPKCR